MSYRDVLLAAPKALHLRERRSAMAEALPIRFEHIPKARDSSLPWRRARDQGKAGELADAWRQPCEAAESQMPGSSVSLPHGNSEVASKAREIWRFVGFSRAGKDAAARETLRWMVRSLLLLKLLVAGTTCAPGGAATSEPAHPTQQADPRVDEAPLHALGAHAQAAAVNILRRSELKAYHGWIKYLQFRSEQAAERFPADATAQRAEHARLEDWSERILGNPGVLGQLRGVQEWAYESRADASGQPFQLNVPTDYDPARPGPVFLYMHGYSGNHLEHTTSVKDHPGWFEVSVLGRSRASNFSALSEADVLDVLDYLEEHWAIDLDRVHINGDSLGGAGAFWIGGRHPHRFASVRPLAGFASDKPIGNLLTLPTYATHSDDDWIVPILQSRGPLDKLRRMGGHVTFAELTGYGHAVWEYQQGYKQSEAWAARQLRPSPRRVRHLDFTALDGNAVRSWWAEVMEWGPEPSPAHFVMHAGPGNFLEMEVSNIARIGLRISESPFEPTVPITVSLKSERSTPDADPIVIQPEPQATYVTIDIGGRSASPGRVQNEDLPVRLHTPGGANQLYAGEPLLIVYGTGGDTETRRALRAAADVASYASTAEWQSLSSARGADGVAHNQNLYGGLDVKADRDVTAADISRSHLVLLGTAAQNLLVARIADRLPVSYSTQSIRFSDGPELDANDRALGLVYYNPLAPQRLLFWIAANAAAAYRADSMVPQIMGGGVTGTDCAVTTVTEPTLVLSRSFDSRWKWRPRSEKSPRLAAGISGRREFGSAVAESVRRAVGADFTISGPWYPSPADPLREPRASDGQAFTVGTTRLSDIIELEYFKPLGVMSLSGAELAAALQGLSAVNLQLQPAADKADLVQRRTYRVAMTSDQLWSFGRSTHLMPRTYEITDLTLADALKRFGPSVLAE